MVIFFSKKYSAVYNTDISDTQQMCWMELIKSIYHYDVDMDFQFINYYIIRLKTTMLRTWGQSINIHITEEEIRKYLRFKSLLYQYNEDIDDPRFIKDCKCLFNENISELFDDYTRKENIFNISNIHNFGDTLFNETEESPDDTIDKAMQSKRVRDAINKLDPTKREILLMNYGLKDNKTYNRDQIASFLDIPLRSVRILRQEGLKELKRILNNEN
jgi:RNA polymerase sigma factor (sigma-70 family)